MPADDDQVITEPEQREHLTPHLVGPARIQQSLTIGPKGDSTSGTFVVDQWDEAGNLLAHVQGKVTGTRVTMETGFESVE